MDGRQIPPFAAVQGSPQGSPQRGFGEVFKVWRGAAWITLSRWRCVPLEQQRHQGVSMFAAGGISTIASGKPLAAGIRSCDPVLLDLGPVTRFEHIPHGRRDLVLLEKAAR